MPGNNAFNVIIVRHGERVDHVFGPQWLNQFFRDGEYVRRDLNMPTRLVQRPPEHWAIDPPLTELGRWQAKQTGEALASVPFNVGAITSSPSARCLQTAEEIRGCLPSLPGVVTEPGLFEMGSWNSPGVAEAFGVRDPYAITAAAPPDETVDEWYQRSDRVFRLLLKRHSDFGHEDLLIVAHGLSAEVLTYGMLYGDNPVPPEVSKAGTREGKIAAMCAAAHQGAAPIESYCGVAVLQYRALAAEPDRLLQLDVPVPLTLTHRSNAPFVYQESARPWDQNGAVGDSARRRGRSLRAQPAAIRITSVPSTPNIEPRMIREGTETQHYSARFSRQGFENGARSPGRAQASNFYASTVAGGLSSPKVAGGSLVSAEPMGSLSARTAPAASLGSSWRQSPQSVPAFGVDAVTLPSTGNLSVSVAAASAVSNEPERWYSTATAALPVPLGALPVQQNLRDVTPQAAATVGFPNYLPAVGASQVPTPITPIPLGSASPALQSPVVAGGDGYGGASHRAASRRQSQHGT